MSAEATDLDPIDELLLACSTWEHLIEELDGTALVAELEESRRTRLAAVIAGLSRVLGATHQIAELVADQVGQFNAQPQEMDEALRAIEHAGTCLYEVHRELDPPNGAAGRY